jgi:hypothetical protein
MNIIEIALKEVGYKETPPNKTKYGKWFGLDGVPWCGIFVSWVYAQSGKPLGNIGFLKGFAGCQTAMQYFTKHNKIVTDPQPGDIVFFDWNKDKRYDHVGIYYKPQEAGMFLSIEGNTSNTNQNNGGMVMIKTREYKYATFIRP